MVFTCGVFGLTGDDVAERCGEMGPTVTALGISDAFAVAKARAAETLDLAGSLPWWGGRSGGGHKGLSSCLP
jgi:hypothetical protein